MRAACMHSAYCYIYVARSQRWRRQDLARGGAQNGMDMLMDMQCRRNYGDGVHCTTPQVQGLYPLYTQVRDAAYVKILSKRL